MLIYSVLALKKCGIISSLLAHFIFMQVNKWEIPYLSNLSPPLSSPEPSDTQGRFLRRCGSYSRRLAGPCCGGRPLAALLSLQLLPQQSTASLHLLPPSSPPGAEPRVVTSPAFPAAAVLAAVPSLHSPCTGHFPAPAQRSSSLLVQQWPPHRTPLVPPVGQLTSIFISLILFLYIDMI
jgi:hypothetical protein